jgi:hypothetical protein
VYKKFGPTLRGPSGIGFIKPNYGISLKFNIKDIDNISGLFTKDKSLASLYRLNCSNCGSSYRVEMHHVRAMKDLNPKIDGIDRLMIKMNRKQISLCRVCHMKKHNR